MARNEEKAQSMRNRFITLKAEEKKKPRGATPYFKELKAKRRTDVVKLWQQGQVERVEEPSQQQWHQELNHFLRKTKRIALVMAFFSAATVSAQDLAPSSTPAVGAGVSLPVFDVIIGFFLDVSALALI
ncbi:hypothetical protein LWI28_025937 [Acer negundo]|uniref:Uncharacterized protein n=1 Tax=Acer negundo TaxID=4023 RepID=A0AAD5JFJ4_ACENE|nr:hypothetical protein LWI28_025937 [Acer negundo]